MPSYTTRVELHDATSEDYTRLHHAMEERGFVRTITSSKGVTYHLPWGEYDFSGSQTRAEVLGMAEEAAGSARRKYEVLVTQSAGRSWSGLDEV